MGASTTNSPSTTPAVTTVHPEDAELIAQLAKLQDMHHQIHHLRSLLPTALIGPARAAISQQSRTGPQVVAEAVIKAARQGSADIRDFQKLWHDEKMRQLFKDANAVDTPQGVDAWMTDYEALASSGPAIMTQPINDEDEEFDTTDQARADLEKQVNDETSRVKLAPGSEIGVFPVTIILADRMRFTINNDQGPRTYTIQAASGHRLAQQISDYLTTTGRAGTGLWKKLNELLVGSISDPDLCTRLTSPGNTQTISRYRDSKMRQM